jgi:hypothetical protein
MTNVRDLQWWGDYADPRPRGSRTALPPRARHGSWRRCRLVVHRVRDPVFRGGSRPHVDGHAPAGRGSERRGGCGCRRRGGLVRIHRASPPHLPSPHRRSRLAAVAQRAHPDPDRCRIRRARLFAVRPLAAARRPRGSVVAAAGLAASGPAADGAGRDGLVGMPLRYRCELGRVRFIRQYLRLFRDGLPRRDTARHDGAVVVVVGHPDRPRSRPRVGGASRCHPGAAERGDRRARPSGPPPAGRRPAAGTDRTPVASQRSNRRPRAVAGGANQRRRGPAGHA